MDDKGSGETSAQSRTELEDRRPRSVDPAPLTCGAILAGRYELRKVIGRGGMGVVVEAHDLTLDEVVAVKIVRADLVGESEWADRLAREVKLARQIHHPNVCRVFDFEQAAGRAFLVMEIAVGGTLRDEIRSGALMQRSAADRLADVRALAAGLGAIHGAGIVHRDLSPQNVLRMGDGRLVVSDFGLATDSFESTNSIRGGTIAYMAPEIVRGSRASFASDVWALGVIVYEIAFGERPRWSAPGGLQMLQPSGARRLSPPERAVLQICRACTAPDPRRRPRRVFDVAARLAVAGSAPSWPWAVARRSAVAACAAVVIAAVTVAAVRHRRVSIPRPPAAAFPDATPTLIPTGRPEDWTDKSIVLAEVPDKIRCAVLLPDHRTVRFVWGRPPRAEDVDTRTGRRVPSPLLPEAYAEGCPDTSPDGRRLVYTGHTADDRAFAFVSTRGDGGGAVPVVPTAEPTMTSDPSWLSDGETFSYDVDMRHMGLYSLASKRTTILPRPAEAESSITSFRYNLRDRIFVSDLVNLSRMELVGFRWPAFVEDVRFAIPREIVDMQSRDGKTYYCSTGDLSKSTPLITVDPRAGQAREAGFVRDQFIRYPLFPDAGLSFVSISLTSHIVVTGADGRLTPITRDGTFWSPARCGGRLVAARQETDSSTIVELDRTGNVIAQLTDGPADYAPVCSLDGMVLFYVRVGSTPGIRRCESGECRLLLEGPALALSMSPDGSRIAFLTVDNRGIVVHWIGADGGPVHDVMETETTCAPGWSSSRTLWVSRRKGKSTLWVEVDADSGQRTGPTAPGLHDCTDATPDLASPVRADVGWTTEMRSQLRLLPMASLPGH